MTALTQLSRRIHAIETELEGNRTPQLAHSSVELEDGTEMGVAEGLMAAVAAGAASAEAIAAAAEAYEAAQNIGPDQIKDNAVTFGKVAAGAIGTQALAAGAVQAKHIGLGVLRTNLVADPSFEEDYEFPMWPGGDAGQWRQEPIGANASITRGVGRGRARSGGKYLILRRATGSDASTVANAYSAAFTLAAGKSYNITWSATSYGAGSSANGGAELTVDAWFGATPSTVSAVGAVNLSEGTDLVPYTISSSTTSESYTTYSFTLDVPAEQTDLAMVVRFSHTGTTADTYVLVDDVSVIEVGVGGATEITAAGLRLFDNLGNEVGAFVSNRPNYFTVSKDGDTLAAISAAGGANFQRLGVEGDEVDITGLNDVRGLTVGGTDLADRLYGMGQGMVARGYLANYTSGLIYNEVGIFEVSFMAMPGREYVVTMSNYLFQFAPGTASGATVPGMSFSLRHTTDGSSPVAGSASFMCSSNAFSPRGGGNDVGGPELVGSLANGTSTPRLTRVLFCASVGYPGTEGAATRGQVLCYSAPMQMRVYDVGPYANFPNDAVENRGGSAWAGEAVSTAPPKTTYTSTWAANSSQTRRGAGASYGQYTVNGTEYTGSTKMLAGYYSGSNANQYAFIGFTGANSTGSETNKTISQALSGATVSKVELYVKNSTFYYSSGLQRFAMTSLTSLPGGTTQAPPAVTYTSNQSFSEGQGKWITLPAAAASAILSGGRVAMIGPGSSTSKDYYSGWVNHAASSGKPALRITYSK